jgi:5-methylcytosine-specific restriction endonuclease McrA
MDRESLQRYLASGLSLSQIGRLVGRDPSTVGYWVRKHGLIPNGRSKYAPKGAPDRKALEGLISQGLSTYAIASHLGVSVSTVRHWLRRYELQTKPGMRRNYALSQSAKGRGAPRAFLECLRHGEVEFFRRPDGGYRCSRCNGEGVQRRRRKVKRLLVEEAGGKCAVCGYDRYAGALEFHHLDPAAKCFGLSVRGVTRSLADLREEAAKCMLLCANCHAEVEAGITVTPHR